MQMMSTRARLLSCKTYIVHPGPPICLFLQIEKLSLGLSCEGTANIIGVPFCVNSKQPQTIPPKTQRDFCVAFCAVPRHLILVEPEIQAIARRGSNCIADQWF